MGIYGVVWGLRGAGGVLWGSVGFGGVLTLTLTLNTPPTPQVLFLGPLMQLCMDCPWRCMEGLRGALGKRGVGGRGGDGLNLWGNLWAHL